MATDREAVPEAYDALVDQYRQKTYVEDANSVLHWDQEVMMPEGGTPARSKQRGALSAIGHDLLFDLVDVDAQVVRELFRYRFRFLSQFAHGCLASGRVSMGGVRRLVPNRIKTYVTGAEVNVERAYGAGSGGVRRFDRRSWNL